MYHEVIFSDLPRSSIPRYLRTCEILNATISDDQFEIASSSDASIKAFNIKNNKKVEFIPRNLAHVFPKLEMLQVFNCSMKVISNQTFINLTTLRELNLAMNEITVISEFAFKDSVNLATLNLSNNKIASLKSMVFSHLTVLNILCLSDNKIKVLEANIFDSLTSLEGLILSGNKIQVIRENTFMKLVNLKKLLLSSNQIEEIDDYLFSDNTKLETIWLHENKINFINHRVFNRLSKLQLVNLRDNVCIDSTFEVCFRRDNRISTCDDFALKEIKKVLQFSCPPYTYTTRYYFKECYPRRTLGRIDKNCTEVNEGKSVFDRPIVKLFFGMWQYLLFN